MAAVRMKRESFVVARVRMAGRLCVCVLERA